MRRRVWLQVVLSVVHLPSAEPAASLDEVAVAVKPGSACIMLMAIDAEPTLQHRALQTPALGVDIKHRGLMLQEILQ